MDQVCIPKRKKKRKKKKLHFPLLSNPSSKPYGEKLKRKTSVMGIKVEEKKIMLLCSQLTYIHDQTKVVK